MNFKYILLLFFSLMVILVACKDPWDEYNKVNDPILAANLMGLIERNPDLTKFRELLVKTGYDKVIASSKTYTVWAPTNDHIDDLLTQTGADKSDSILNKFISYHIAQQTYFTRNTGDTTMRIMTVSGKSLHFTKTMVEDASIVLPDQYTGNGVLHVINRPLIVKRNMWEVIKDMMGDDVPVAQLSFLTSAWQIREFDVNSSIQTGVNERGLPVYDSVFVEQNGFLKNVADIRDERRQYTFFVLSDDAFDMESRKLRKFFVDSTEAATSFRTNVAVVKDLVVRGRYDAEHLPPVLLSSDSTRFSINRSSIVRSITASNGIIHVVKSVEYQMSDKLPQIYVQGESYSQASHPSSDISFSRRTRKAPDGTVFRDVMNNTHKVNGAWLRFLTTAYSGNYKVYWRMVRDFALVPAANATDVVHFRQKVTWNERWKLAPDAVFDPLTSAGLGYKNEPVINNPDGTFSPDYNEVFLGEMAIDRYGSLDVYLVANQTATVLQNAILLDYIRLEPVY